MNDINKKINLQFDDTFFEEEIRCDYKVSEKTKKIWAVEIDLLNELIKACKKHDIKMSIFAGTLLGAVRHKGVIPWDDDIDVCFLREEYDKLLKVAPQEFKYPYFFQNDETDPRYFMGGCSRLRNSLTTGRISWHNSPDYNNGIYIDVFVLDGYSYNEDEVIKQHKKLGYLAKIASLYKLNQSSSNFIKSIVKKVLYGFLNLSLFRLYDFNDIYTKYTNELQKYNVKSDRVSLISSPLFLKKKYWCKREDLKEIVYIPFENIMVPAPANYDQMLKNMYGNYMEYPPKEKRGVWHENVIEFDPDTPYKDFMQQKRN